MGIFSDRGFQYWQVEFGEFAYFRVLHPAVTQQAKVSVIRYMPSAIFPFFLFTFYFLLFTLFVILLLCLVCSKADWFL